VGLLIAWVAAAATAVTGTLAVAGRMAHDAHPAQCAPVLAAYREFISGSNKAVTVLTEKGDDRLAPVDVDPAALACGIDRATLRHIVDLPVPEPTPTTSS
jgi:hypothetical protein